MSGDLRLESLKVETKVNTKLSLCSFCLFRRASRRRSTGRRTRSTIASVLGIEPKRERERETMRRT